MRLGVCLRVGVAVALDGDNISNSWCSSCLVSCSPFILREALLAFWWLLLRPRRQANTRMKTSLKIENCSGIWFFLRRVDSVTRVRPNFVVISAFLQSTLSRARRYVFSSCDDDFCISFKQPWAASTVCRPVSVVSKKSIASIIKLNFRRIFD